ncbi:hypothetical protein PFDG_00138 [Plasmodium falciparum Dd2]|uniref:Rifin n=1 Tax=Plasmodium falciparum (isolate Dd2) TaxID=57267 RepID=A0A0L7LWD3_PLAF4|nr:hypothetical protein PFDG_00138 [Plasmodium falciparum Dd2]
MKVHYSKILLFSLSLIILAHNKNKPYITTRTPNTTSRLLIECNIYMPNYDSDPDMKSVKENFYEKTEQRFHEYDKRMINNRRKCKDKCDKEIQKIILKDKLEKELTEKFATLQTDIQSDAIPTCVCEKSLADKVEKGCLRCGSVFGGGVAPSVGILGGIGEAAISVLKPAAIEAAKEAAVTEATALATQAGIKAVISKINVFLAFYSKEEILFDLKPIVNKSNFSCGSSLFQRAEELASKSCVPQSNGSYTSFCNSITYGKTTAFKGFAQAGSDAFQATLTTKTAEFKETYMAAVNTTYGGYHISIIASVVAILIIVLIMVIIYLILRYRKKKKMKKKLQYIKLLEE